METYHKIDSIFKRDINGKFTSEYACPEFEYLQNNEWEFTEKIDGTNIRICYENGKLVIGGRTDNAQIPTFLYEKLTDLFSDFNEENMTLYGEGYGAKIQKGGERYIADGVSFILFDVRVGEWWLRRADVIDIAAKYDLRWVPVIGHGTLHKAIDWCMSGFDSAIANREAEGIVLRPTVELFKRNGDRIITKVKIKDFR